MTLPLVVGISGATGAVYGIELLRVLKKQGQPTHLILSEMAVRTIAIETDLSVEEVRSLADVVHSNKDLAASVSSGSFRTRGMVVVPCSVKTLSGIANGFSNNLLIRAADVTLKERRPLIVVFRETPLHTGHLRLMLRAAEIGTVIVPPMPAFYHRPKSIDEIVRQTVGRVLDQLGIVHDLSERWSGDDV
jgi:4-hydroxy-3-polyprenylbenzoate decarboxylase